MQFSSTLLNWYVQHKRSLPWRNTKNPYIVWLSEIILQQTKVTQGLPYFLKFEKKFPTVFDLAKADEQEILKLWQGLGYYSRARNLHKTAKDIVANYNGVFPNTYKELLKLKGVGDYTASAIASFCFGESTAVVDGNVYRFLSRYFGVSTPINSTAGKNEFKKLAQKLLDTKQPAAFNQAIMDFGSLQCKPKNPECKKCVFNISCFAFLKQKTTHFPVKEKRIKIKKRYFNYLVFKTEKNTTILEKRTKGIWQGLYQFPLIETKEEVHFDGLAIKKEFLKIVPNQAKIKLFLKNEKPHKLSHQHIYTKFWLVSLQEKEDAKINWQDVKKYPVPILIANFLKKFI